MYRAYQFGKVAVCWAACVALLAAAVAFGYGAWTLRELGKETIARKAETHAIAAQLRSDEHLITMDAHNLVMGAGVRVAQLGPAIENVRKTTVSVSTAMAKWEKASDRQIENVDKTGEDTRRVIAHFDRILTNQVVPALSGVPAAVTSITGTANAATDALNATKKPMEALDGILRDKDNGVPKLLTEANGTMVETHATAGNFEVWSDKLTHPASAVKQWFMGLLDTVFKFHSIVGK